jgi:hypothetical protein
MGTEIQCSSRGAEIYFSGFCVQREFILFIPTTRNHLPLENNPLYGIIHHTCSYSNILTVLIWWPRPQAFLSCGKK